MMKRLIALALLAIASGASAADRLLSPDWANADLQHFLRDKSRTSVELQPFTLPVLGLWLEKSARSNATGELRLNATTGSSIRWPSCAGEAKVSLAADDSRTWFARQYDFGCIQIAIGGDRHADDRGNSPASEEAAGMPQISVVDENGDPTAAGSVRIDFVRYNIPYSVTAECAEAAKSFCSSSENIRKLAASLVVEGGSPR